MIPQGDAPIPDGEVLYRRIHCSWITWEDGPPRPSSVAFKDRKEGKLSVAIARETSVKNLLRGRPEDSVISFVAGQARSQGLRVERDFDPDNPGHAVLIPAPKSAAARRLAEGSRWVKFRNPRSMQFKARRWFRSVPSRLLSILKKP